MAPGLEPSAAQRVSAGRASAQATRQHGNRREPPQDAAVALSARQGPSPADVEDDVDEALLIDQILGHLRAERG